MRSAAKLLLQAGALQQPAASQAASALPQLVRQMAGAPAHQTTPETPLSKILPSIVTIPRQIVNTAFSLTGKLIGGVASSGPAKSIVGAVANKVVIEEALIKVSDLDPSYWAYWLSACGYNGQSGFKKLSEAAKAKVAGMDADQVSNLVNGLHKVGYYDKELFDGIAKNISSNFTRFETEQLLKVVVAFADNSHYSTELFDDIADSITYANHYLAPVKVPTNEISAALAAYAKFKHERADLFVTLARGISEVGLSKLTAEARRTAVVQALRSLDAFNFYPEQVDALLYYANAESAGYTADEIKDVQRVQHAVEAQAGGKLSTYVENHTEDAVHWYGHHHHAPAHYDLYVFRDNLVPKNYSPASMRKK